MINIAAVAADAQRLDRSLVGLQQRDVVPVVLECRNFSLVAKVSLSTEL